MTATEDSQYSELFVTSYSVDEKSSLRIFCNADKEDIVNLILNTAIEGEKKLTYLNRDKENSKKELEEVKKKNKTIYIPQKLVGLIIGKDGINVKNLKNKYGVNITIDSKKENEKKPAEVIITGDDGAKVEECSKEIDVKQKIFEVSEACSIDIKKRVNAFYVSKDRSVDVYDRIDIITDLADFDCSGTAHGMSHKADLVSIYMCEDIKNILSGRIIFEPVAAGIIVVSACDQGI